MKAIYLDPALRTGSAEASSASGLPATYRSEPHQRRCLALHPVGFTVPAASRPPRCALTAPFHPYRRGRRPGPTVASAAGGAICRNTGHRRAGRPTPIPPRRRYVLCGTIPIPARRSRRRGRNGGRYPPPWLSGARTFLPPHMRGKIPGRRAAFHAAGHGRLYATAAPVASHRRFFQQISMGRSALLSVLQGRYGPFFACQRDRPTGRFQCWFSANAPFPLWRGCSNNIPAGRPGTEAITFFCYELYVHGELMTSALEFRHETRCILPPRQLRGIAQAVGPRWRSPSFW